MIGADFVYVGLPDERPPIDIVMTPAPVDAARRNSIAAVVKREIGRAGGRQAISIANPSSGEPLRLAIAPIGLDGVGVIAAGAEAGGFPTETQRLLIGMAASLATLALHRWHGETEMRRFVALVESSADFVGYADLDGTAKYVNPAGMRLMGLGEHEKVPPLHILEFLVPGDRARARDEAWPIVRRSGRWVGELTFRHFAGGAEIPILLDWFRIDDSRTGDAINIAAVGKDLRAQKSAELELRHLNETLESRVAQRTAELADANQKILTEMREHERLESRLRVANLELGHAARLSTAGQMAAAIAHELNQPLTAIVNSLGAAKRLLQPGTFISVGPALEVMDEAVQQSLRAGQVVVRLRNFLIPGNTETRVEDVATMVEEATTLALIGPSASGVKMRVRLDPEAPYVLGNRIEVQQVLINLIRNSLEAMAGADRRELKLSTMLRPPTWSSSPWPTADSGIDPDVADRISSRSSPPSAAAWAWACRSADRSLNRTAAASSSNSIPKAEPSFASLSPRSRLRGISMPTERTIHVVDDDAAVRLSLERLLGSMQFATVSYTTPAAFLLQAPQFWAAAFFWTSRCQASTDLRCRRTQGHWIRSAGHRHHRAGRHPDRGSCHESRRFRFPGEALRERGSAGRDRGRARRLPR